MTSAKANKESLMQELNSITHKKQEPQVTGPEKKVSIFNNPGKSKIAHAYSKLVTAVRKNIDHRINSENDRQGRTGMDSKLLMNCKSITNELESFIRERGEELYNNKDLSKDPKKFIPELISLATDI